MTLRRRHITWWITLLIAALLTACHGEPKSASVAWQAPVGQWTVDARDGKHDVSVTVANQGPGAARLTRLAAAGEADLSSPAAFVASLQLDKKNPTDALARLTSFVYDNLELTRRPAEMRELGNQPLKVLAMLGQGEAEDFARTLALLLQMIGIDSAIYNMDRHFATAVRWDDGWRLADPTYGFTFFDRQTGDYPTLPELGLRLPLVEDNVNRAPRWKNKGDILELYEWYLQQDPATRLQAVGGDNPALEPWPLPAGASVTYDLACDAQCRGTWRWERHEGWLDAEILFLEYAGMVKRLYGFGPEENPPTGSIRLSMDLPFPVDRAALTVTAQLPTGADPRLEVFITRGTEVPADTTRVFKGRHDFAQPLRVERLYEQPAIGPTAVEIRFLPAVAFVTGLDWEVGFVHGKAAAPHVAGKQTSVSAEASVDGSATLTTTHRWR